MSKMAVANLNEFPREPQAEQPRESASLSILRRRLKKFVSRMGKDAKDKVEDWRDDVKAELSRRRRQIREQIER